MPYPGFTTSELRRRFRLASTLLVIVVSLSTLLSINEGYASRSHYYRYRTTGSPYVRRHPPSAAQQAATLVVTQQFRREVVTAAQDFAVSTAQLSRDIARANLAAARRDELRAQGDFDVLRLGLAPSLLAADPLDALIEDQPANQPLVGLHAIERDLWVGTLDSAQSVATQLDQQAQVLPFIVYRTIATPSQAAVKMNEVLAWAVENVIATPQEIYSHHDVIDVRAVVGALDILIPPMVKLERLVDVSLANQLMSVETKLSELVGSLAPSLSDESIDATTWRRVAGQFDAVQAVLGAVAGSLDGFGTGRTYA